MTVDYSGPGFARKPIPADLLSQAGVVEFQVSGLTVNEDAGTVTLNVLRHDGSTGAIAVTYATREGTAKAGQDFVAKSGQLQFADGQASRPITIDLIKDSLAEPDEYFTVDLTGISGGGTIGARRSAQIVIKDVRPSNPPPIVKTPPKAKLASDGMTAKLSVLGSDDGGEKNLTYLWSVSSMPGGSPTPAFGVGNGTHASSKLSVRFFKAGTYTLTVTITDAHGGTAVGNVVLTVDSKLSALSITPSTASVRPGGTLQFFAQGLDQFGDLMVAPTGLSWSATSGSITKNGFYTAPNKNKVVTVTVRKGSIKAKATVTVSSAVSLGLAYPL